MPLNSAGWGPSMRAPRACSICGAGRAGQLGRDGQGKSAGPVLLCAGMNPMWKDGGAAAASRVCRIAPWQAKCGMQSVACKVPPNPAPHRTLQLVMYMSSSPVVAEWEGLPPAALAAASAGEFFTGL